MGKARESIQIPGATARAAPPPSRAWASGDPRSEPVRHNFDENPSFETNLNGVGVNDVTISQSSDEAKYGTYSCRIERTGSNPYTTKSRADGSGFPASPGQSCIYSMWGRFGSGVTGTVRVYLVWYDSDDNFLNSNNLEFILYDSSWTRCAVVAEAVPGTASVRTLILLVVPQVGDIVYTDGQELRKEAVYVGPYIDGDQELCEWIGAAHGSASAHVASLSRPPMASSGKAELTPLARARMQQE